MVRYRVLVADQAATARINPQPNSSLLQFLPVEPGTAAVNEVGRYQWIHVVRECRIDRRVVCGCLSDIAHKGQQDPVRFGQTRLDALLRLKDLRRTVES